VTRILFSSATLYSRSRFPFERKKNHNKQNPLIVSYYFYNMVMMCDEVFL